MSGLAVLWAVQGSSGSFALGGAASGAFALADAIVGPQVARVIDRHGQRRVVFVTATVFAAAGIGLVLACSWSSSGVVMIGLAAVAGATAPPVGALSAARWRKTVGSPPLLAAALSLEGSLNDAAFLVGPVVVTVLSATVATWCGLLVSVVLISAGMIGMLTARATEPARDRSSRGILVDSRLVNVRFLALFAANLAMGLFFGGIGVAITAFAIAHGAGALAGVISAAGGVVSLSVGLAYGALERGRPVKTMIAAGGILAVGCALLALAPSLPVMVVGYGLVGGCVALVLIPGSILLQRTTASGAYTQAMTWINSASAIGIATSAPLVGYVIQVHTWVAGFLGLAALTALLPVTLLVAYPVLGRTERRR